MPLPGARAYVTGDAAYVLDSTRIFTDGIPLVLAFVLGLSFLLLLVAFRSIVIPATAIVLNLLSTAAAYGILTLVFQDGWFANAIGITPGPVIESFVPLFVFTIVYGLSMDYHFFILTRIKEARDRGLDSKSAVAHGHLGDRRNDHQRRRDHGRRVLGLRDHEVRRSIQQLGLGLAVAVFVDATVIRSILLPAVMRLLGDWNWYLPSFLGWLPRVTIESGVDERPADSHPSADHPHGWHLPAPVRSPEGTFDA